MILGQCCDAVSVTDTTDLPHSFSVARSTHHTILSICKIAFIATKKLHTTESSCFVGRKDFGLESSWSKVQISVSNLQ
jgi:hypothetical protein